MFTVTRQALYLVIMTRQAVAWLSKEASYVMHACSDIGQLYH